MNSIKKSETGKVDWPNNLKAINIISWTELLKPENGFVNNNSIILEVEIKADKPEGDVGPMCVIKPNQFECSICLEGLVGQDMSITTCGHTFCTACITTAIRNHAVCPLCQEAAQLNDLRRMYLTT